MERITKRALKTPLKNCEKKVAQAGFQRASFRGALLLGAVLLSLLFIGNLQAQSSVSTKQGFFAGIVYLQGFGVDTTKTSTNSATGFRISGYRDATSRIDTNFKISGVIPAGIKALMKANCERDATTVTQPDGVYSFREGFFSSFTAGARPSIADLNDPLNDATVTGLNINIPSRNFRTGLTEGETSYCYRYFYGDLSHERTAINFSAYDVTADTLSKSSLPSTKSDALNGVGLQVGWRGEKWRASLTHFTGKGGTNELVNTVVMAEYFFHEEFFAGGGLASMKLTNGSTSASATSPVLTVGYKENLTPNLFFNISLTKYISGVSLSRSTPASAPIPTGAPLIRKTQTERGDSATIGSSNLINAGSSATLFHATIVNGIVDSDLRIEVTQVGSRDVEIQEVETPAAEKIEAEIKAPVVVSISLLWRF